MREATDAVHRRLEERLDAVAQLADRARRPGLIARYAAFHLPADDVLRPFLDPVPELEFVARSRAQWLAPFANANAVPAFPKPGTRWEALGLLYVLEGSALGGRVILRALAARGAIDPVLGFLDPYGSETGRLWRGFLSVLDRETGDDEARITDAVQGSVRGFAHAERVLCGVAS
jgi:heme oxygenase